MDVKEYLQNPCGTLSIPYWKAKTLAIPDSMRIIHCSTLGPIIVDATLSVASYILAEAGLSFLGMGVPSNIPTWGNIINAAKRLDIIQTMPMLWIAPGVAISLFVLSINFFGDGLRDVFDAAQ